MTANWYPPIQVRTGYTMTPPVIVWPSAYVIERYDSSGRVVRRERQPLGEPRPLTWWRCDYCSRANGLDDKGRLLVACPSCGAPIPERYTEGA